MIERLIRQLALAGALSLISMSGSAAIVNGVMPVFDASITDLYSATLDGGCTTGGSFFVCLTLPAGRSVAVTDIGTSPTAGFLDVQYDDVSLQITQINAMQIILPDMDLTITNATFGNADIEIRQGNAFPAVTNDDVPRILGGTATLNYPIDAVGDLGKGTADADQNPGSASVFQHDDSMNNPSPPPTPDAPDFSIFSDVVDLCTPTSAGSITCNLIPGLSIDGVRYQLDGLFGDSSLLLTTETGNNSRYTVAISTVPVPAAVWLFGSALGLLGWMRRRAA